MTSAPPAPSTDPAATETATATATSDPATTDPGTTDTTTTDTTTTDTTERPPTDQVHGDPPPSAPVVTVGASLPPTTDPPDTSSIVVPPISASPVTVPTDSAPAISIVANTEPTQATTAPPVTGPSTTPPLTNLAAVFAHLAGGNTGTSISVWRDHAKVFGQAWGLTTTGAPMTSDSPLVLASVSKLITALTIARLAEQGRVDVAAPVPWDQMFVAHDPGWNDVTVRELLDHTSGMPKMLGAWTGPPGACSIPLATAMSRPPTGNRGTWTYSNGNYCALGLLIQTVTGMNRDEAADQLVFDPIDVTGPHLTTDGLLPDDGPYPQGVARLERLGGAGTWMASTDDLAAMLDSVTPADLQTLRNPGIVVDQYGWGHTGTVDGAKSCAWVLEGGRTVVVATVAGDRPVTGGKLCDQVLPAIATDLGIFAGPPVRQPD